ncbi:hypothetical protein PJP10_32760, partial [Mycobacterium kansasii]
EKSMDSEVDETNRPTNTPHGLEPKRLNKSVAPFPQRLIAPKPLSNSLNILELLKQVKVNIPLLDVVKQIPSYARFLKDV